MVPCGVNIGIIILGTQRSRRQHQAQHATLKRTQLCQRWPHCSWLLGCLRGKLNYNLNILSTFKNLSEQLNANKAREIKWIVFLKDYPPPPKVR